MPENDKNSGPVDDDNVDATIVVQIIVPVHNAAATIETTIASALAQVTSWETHICCYDDGSTDESWYILQRLQREHEQRNSHKEESNAILLHIAQGSVARGAGYARNRAVQMIPASSTSSATILCFLDSDDVMHPQRVSAQTTALLRLPPDQRDRTIVGCTFDRDPPDATTHYTHWANNLSDQRLYLEQYREMTILQPTWCMMRCRFDKLGGYLEAPSPPESGVGSAAFSLSDYIQSLPHTPVPPLIHPAESPATLRVAEDLRLFHAHLQHDNGRLQLLRHAPPLVTYRHTMAAGGGGGTQQQSLSSQSGQTSRVLLLQLRALALERRVLLHWPRFVIWGAGRDGKAFYQALSPSVRRQVACFVDVDPNKLAARYYVLRNNNADKNDNDDDNTNVKIPIVHISWLARDHTQRELLQQEAYYGKVRKGYRDDHDDASSSPSPRQCHKRPKPSWTVPPELDARELPHLPVIVCVAMYRTNGALERNVRAIARVEGETLWHFS